MAPNPSHTRRDDTRRPAGGGHHHADDGGPTRIDAPYSFVPLAERVVIPEWGGQVSHDRPFREGVSGSIRLTLTARSPLLVGGEQIKANDEHPGEVRFFQAPDGRYAIPGSSLRGMVRAALEILSYSRFSGVDDKRYGLRDISGAHVKETYGAKVRNQMQSGFLRLNRDGEPELVPCSMVRLSHRDLAQWWSEPAPVFDMNQCRAVKRKYQRWEQLCRRHGIGDPWRLDFDENGREVTRLGGGTQGFPVLTGQVSHSTRDDDKGKKYKDFVFYDRREDQAFTLASVDERAWRDFLFVHGDDEERKADEMSWPGFWKGHFWERREVPVFYLRSGRQLRIGLAFMPRLAGDFSIHDMIRHTSPGHLEAEGLDFATLLFGRVGEHPQDALKGRVFIEPAFAEGKPQPLPARETILNSPKPSYFPNYIEQRAGRQPNRLEPGEQYATYIHTAQHPAPRLRGWKRYPARPDDEVEIQRPTDEQKSSVRIRLHPLPTDTVFTTTVHFHNLRPEELGALLWALDLGGEGRRHGLGLAKSFGYGQVEVALESEGWIANDPSAEPPGDHDCRDRFENYMAESLGMIWRTTPEVASLLTLADPARRDAFPGRLRHMVLTTKPKRNDFLRAKQGGLILGAYALPEPEAPPAARWLDEQIAALSADNANAKPEDILRGKLLAAAWQQIDEPGEQAAALAEIQRRWRAQGWWDHPPGKASKAAKKIYEGEG